MGKVIVVTPKINLRKKLFINYKANSFTFVVRSKYKCSLKDPLRNDVILAYSFKTIH